MIARRARLDPPRTGRVHGDGAPDRGAARFCAKQQSVIHWLEGELLPMLVQQRFNLAQAGAGARREHEFIGLIERHACQRGRGERLRLRRVAAEPRLGAAADDRTAVAFRLCRANGVDRVRLVADFERRASGLHR